MAAPDLEWPRLAIEAIGAAASGFAGLLVGVWRWGRHSALGEQRLRDDYLERIEDMKGSLAAAEQTHDARIGELVGQFKEAFAGIRRQIDDGRLYTEQTFVRKDDFKEMREEIREDMRDIKRSLNELRNGKGHG